MLGTHRGIDVIRILHTADWHIGHTLRRFGRETEHNTAIEQVRIAVPTLIGKDCVCGDAQSHWGCVAAMALGMSWVL